MLKLIASGHYYGELADDSAPLSVREALQEVDVERYRRIDRYTELCLLGAARCRANAPAKLDPATGIYLGSGYAGIANTAQVQQQVIQKGQLPKPANFINTLSNSAGYYVARTLGLQHQNYFVSRGAASLLAILQIAALDLCGGVVNQALVGVVDECDRNLDWHRRRQGLPAQTPMAEGSHWFLLEAGMQGEGFSALQTLDGDGALRDWLFAHRGNYTHVYFGQETGSRPINLNLGSLGVSPFVPDLACYPSRLGGVVMAWQERPPGAGLLLVQGDADGRFHLGQWRNGSA